MPNLNSHLDTIKKTIELEFNSPDDVRALRAVIYNLGEAFNNIRVDLIFADISEQFKDTSMPQCLYMEAMSHLEIASLKFKQVANSLEHKE